MSYDLKFGIALLPYRTSQVTIFGHPIFKTMRIIPRPRTRRMSRMRAVVYFISGWVSLLTAIFLVYCDRLGKAAEEEQYKLVYRLTTVPDAKKCNYPTAGLSQYTHERLTAPVYMNDSFHIPTAIEANRTSRSRCHLTRTRGATIYGLPKAKNGTIELTAGPVHEIRIISIGSNGENRCAGGDYYETDLSGTFWRSRPPVIDVQDGSYRVSLQVDMRFAGLYVLRIILLFSNFHGLDLPPDSWVVETNNSWARMEVIRNLNIQFVIPNTNSDNKNVTCSPQLAKCTSSDYTLRHWTGRWTREVFNMLCETRERRPSKCLKPGAQCTHPWCSGPVGLLLSNGWVYSAHCSFKIFTRGEAWSCLNRKWLFWVGDSIEQEIVRNLLTIVLGLGVEEVDSILEQDNADHKFIRSYFRKSLADLENIQYRSIHNTHHRSDHSSVPRQGEPNGAPRDSRLRGTNLKHTLIRPQNQGHARTHWGRLLDFALQTGKHLVYLIRTDKRVRTLEEQVKWHKENDHLISAGAEEELGMPERAIYMRKELHRNLENKITRTRAKRKLDENPEFIRVSFVHNSDGDKKRSQPLYSSANTKFLESIKAKFFWGTTPDFIIVDFGFRNAWYFQDAKNFVEEGLKLAISFWRKVLQELLPRFPLFIYRSAFAVVGGTRTTFLNPHKVEFYNRIIAEKVKELQEKFPNVRILDAFDISFPWHFDQDCSSDGVHHGTAQAENEGHEYIVNLMLVHVLLNSMC